MLVVLRFFLSYFKRSEDVEVKLLDAILGTVLLKNGGFDEGLENNNEILTAHDGRVDDNSKLAVVTASII